MSFLVFVDFYNCFYNCYTVLMFALLVANWPFCSNKFDLILKFYSSVNTHLFLGGQKAAVRPLSDHQQRLVRLRDFNDIYHTYLPCE